MKENQDTSRLSAVKIETPVGVLVAVVDGDDALVRLDFARPDDVVSSDSWRGLAVAWDDPDAGRHVVRQVDEYFDGSRASFDLELAPRGGGAFDREVWRTLPEIVPFGSTAAYGEVARRLGRPGAARAVGHAMATNPISLVMPCHRVVGADGRLVGYGGGDGVPTKRALLAHEARLSD